MSERKRKYTFDQSDPAFERFIRKIKSPASRKAWISALNQYMEYRHCTKYSQLLKGKPQQHEEWIEEYIAYRQDKGTRAQSVGSQVTGLRKFYRANKVKGIDWEEVREALGETVRAVEDKPYTHEQIARLAAASAPKIRIVEYSEAQGGPRVGAFPKMKLGDLTRLDELGLYRVKVYPLTEDAYVTFFGPEASKEIDEYLERRRRDGEELTPASPLIREDYTPKTVKTPKFIAKKTIEGAIERAAKNAGLRFTNKGGGPDKRKETMLTHGLRKFFKQQCRRAGLDPIVIEWLVGHKSGEAKIGISKLMMVYDPAQEDELLTEYLKAVDNLTINEENRLKRRNVILEKRVEVRDEKLAEATEALKIIHKEFPHLFNNNNKTDSTHLTGETH